MKSVNQLVTEIKQNNEDWEWLKMTVNQLVTRIKKG